MKCVHHPEKDATAFCAQCGRALCDECKRDVRGTTYCEECLAARVTAPGLPPLLREGPSPGLALTLSIIPGVGAAYNGQVIKGLVQLAIFIGLWAVAQRVDVVGWAVAAWWIYVAIDSYQTAKRKQMGLPTQEWFGLGEESVKMNAPFGAILLIGIGILILLDNMGLHIFEQVGKFWPVLLIVVGLLLLQRRMSRGPTHNPSGSQPPGAHKEGPGNFPGPQGM